MAKLLQWVGAIWAVLGVVNVFLMPWGEKLSTFLSFGIILNMLIYVFPGLVLLGIGYAIERKAETAQDVDDFSLDVDNREPIDTSDQDKDPIRPRSYLEALGITLLIASCPWLCCTFPNLE